MIRNCSLEEISDGKLYSENDMVKADTNQPMAIVTIGGLTYATVLTLFIVPIMYDILHRRELKPIIIEESI